MSRINLATEGHVVYDSIAIAEGFESVRRVRALGAGTPETSYYKSLEVLFEQVGASLSLRC
jgi:hypothetical protein